MGRTAAACLLVASAVGCGDPVTAVQDSARCPGEECTDDTRDRFDAIGDIVGVVEVVEVSRDYGFDRGASRRAEVTAEVGSAEQAREMGLAVMRELDDWPDHADGPAVVVVRPADQASGVDDVTLLLDGDWVCEQLDGVRRPCGPANSLADFRETRSTMKNGIPAVSEGHFRECHVTRTMVAECRAPVLVN